MKPAQPLATSYNDCLRLSLASILELHPRRVPDFVKRYGDNWEREVEKWLARRNLKWYCFGISDYGNLSLPWIPRGYWIAIVDNDDIAMESHAIVMKGRRKVYDPGEWDLTKFTKRRRYFCGYEITEVV